MRVPVPLLPGQPLACSFFQMLVIPKVVYWYIIGVYIYVSLKTVMISIMCLFVILLSSLMKYLFKSFIHFLLFFPCY